MLDKKIEEQKKEVSQERNGVGQPQQLTATIPYPDRQVFEGQTINTTERLMISPQPVFIFDHVEYPEDGGIFVFLKGVPYPTKGFPTPEACQAVNIAKRILISQLKFFIKSPLAGISLLRKKNLETWLEEYHNICYIAMGQYYFKYIRYSQTSRELWRFIKIFLENMGIKAADHTDLDAYARMFVTLLEYDNAYLFRFQDIMNETTAKLLADNPRKEMIRLLKLFFTRETRLNLSNKIEMLVKLATFILLIPKVKKAFRKTLMVCDFSHLQMDEIDRYNVLRWDKYNFFGQDVSKRMETYFRIHNGKLPQQYVMQYKPGPDAGVKMESLDPVTVSK